MIRTTRLPRIALVGSNALWLFGPGLVDCARAATAWTAASTGLSIDHKAIGCIVAGRFPHLEARIDPAETVSRAQIDFHAEGDPRWYFVIMKPEHGLFSANLPRPLRQTKKIHYYIEVVDKSLLQARTEEYAPIVAGAGECSKKGLLVATPMAAVKVVVGSGCAAAGFPAGFAADGVVSSTAAATTGTAGAGGGGHATVITLGVVGAGAAAAAVALATGGSGSPSSQQPSLTGQWTGTGADGVILLNPGSNCPRLEWDLFLDIQQAGTSLSGTYRKTIRREDPPCAVTFAPDVFPFTGTITGNSIRLEPGPLTPYVGTVQGNRMSGTIEGSTLGTWSAVRQ